MTEFERGKFEVLDYLSSVWHGKQYYFIDYGDRIYSRDSCKDMTLDEAIEEFADRIDAISEPSTQPEF